MIGSNLAGRPACSGCGRIRRLCDNAISARLDRDCVHCYLRSANHAASGDSEEGSQTSAEDELMSAIDTYLNNNAKYADIFSKEDLPISPTHGIAVIACMDARLETGALLGLLEGDAHVIRNAGGVVTDDVIRSLAISQAIAGTREVMLIHHTDCGMQKLTDEEMKDRIESRTGARPPYPMETFADLDGDVLQSIARIKASPLVAYKDAIRGFVYEVETGRLREVG